MPPKAFGKGAGNTPLASGASGAGRPAASASGHLVPGANSGARLGGRRRGFPDVACPGPFTDWIEELVTEGITVDAAEGTTAPPRP